MAEKAEFLDLLGFDKNLLFTPDERGIALIDNEQPFARVYLKSDGTVVLSAATDVYAPPDDFRINVRH